MNADKYQLPWRTEKPYQDIPGVVYISGQFPGSIATVYCANFGTQQADNAEFIVKAANSHHQLVDLLRQCLTDEFGITSKALIADIEQALAELELA